MRRAVTVHKYDPWVAQLRPEEQQTAVLYLQPNESHSPGTERSDYDVYLAAEGGQFIGCVSRWRSQSRRYGQHRGPNDKSHVAWHTDGAGTYETRNRALWAMLTEWRGR